MQQQIFLIRRIKFLGKKEVSILCQSHGGPCSLLAALNVLLLRKQLFVSKAALKTEEVLEILADALVGASPKNENQERNLSDLLAILPSLSAGLDINPCFDGSFEFVPGLSVWDLLGVKIVHGWLPDPEEAGFAVLSKLSFNTAAEQLIARVDEVREGEVVEEFAVEEEAVEEVVMGHVIDPVTSVAADGVREFLEQNPSQLTYFGLRKLTETMNDNELAVIYRNGHFHVLFHRAGMLFTLVTDEGYVNTNIVWESLAVDSGDSVFYTDEFLPCSEGTAEAAPLASDEDLALQLQMEEQASQRRPKRKRKNKKGCVVQ